MKLVVATGNRHKREEIYAILAAQGLRGVEVLGLDRWPELPEPPEEAGTFTGNALDKARFVFAHTGLPTVADDSGLEVDALGGAPGVHSKRFSPDATAEANNALLLSRLAGEQRREARFRCVLALVSAAGERTVAVACEGRIATSPRGVGGFGYDPLFLPDEAPGRTMAELSSAEKNTISHRGRAFRHLPALLQELLGELLGELEPSAAPPPEAQ